MPRQSLAVASQKFTWPGVTGLPASVTVANKVTTVPAATVVTGLPANVTVSVVVVGFVAPASAACRRIATRTKKNVIACDSLI